MSKAFTRRFHAARHHVQGVSYRAVYATADGSVHEQVVLITAGGDLHSYVRDALGAVGEYLVEQIGFQTAE
ncbi:MAG: hypothetical protein ACREGJ_04350 [Candidatus Saccharimonadales bacterium]